MIKVNSSNDSRKSARKGKESVKSSAVNSLEIIIDQYLMRKEEKEKISLHFFHFFIIEFKSLTKV